MVLPLKWAVGSSIPASPNFARPLSVTTTPKLFGSRWFASESRKIGVGLGLGDGHGLVLALVSRTSQERKDEQG
jgi:hypothetical protein